MNSCKFKTCDNCKSNILRNCYSNNYFTTTVEINNNNLPPFGEESSVQEFYKDGKILITGSTGFIGKALTEKLLRTCVTVSTIYLLIRPKKGQSVDERCHDLLNNPVSNLQVSVSKHLASNYYYL